MMVKTKKQKSKKLSSKGKLLFRAKIHVALKKSVFDPQGKTVLDALHSLGFQETVKLRVGKFFDLELQARNQKEAQLRVKTMCEKLLINPVIEEYSFDIESVWK